MIEVIGYTSAPSPELVIAAMRVGISRIEPKLPSPEFTVRLINRFFDDLDLFQKAQAICDKRRQEQLELHVALASELLRKRQLEGRQLSTEELRQLLPICAEDDPLNAQTQLQQNLTGIRPNVLVLEDEGILRDIVCDGIAFLNCNPVPAASISEAKSHLDRVPQIDIALLDVGLPDGHGADLIDVIQRRHPNAAIVMLTAFTDLELIMGCFKKGAIDYLTKPFDVTQFNATFGRLLFQQRTRQFFASDQINRKSSDIPKPLLEEYAEIRSRQGNPVLMKEVCMFYPELKRLGISGDTPALSIPSGKLFHEAFVETLTGLLSKVRI